MQNQLNCLKRNYMKPIGMTFSQNLDEAYRSFLNKCSDLYHVYFPKKQIKLKSKDLQSP